MPIPREAFAVLKAIVSVVFLLSLLGVTGYSQTSLNDVHVAPRATAPAMANAVASGTLVNGTLLHVVKTDVRLVLVPVSVTDPAQRLVTGLHAENFELFEGKKPQEIRHFSSEDLPVSIGIILDASGSMANKMARVRDAVNLADVAGKGAAAALLMSATRGILRSLAETCSHPADVLNRLNRVLANDFPAGRFVTMVYAVLDPAVRTVTFANAGHLQPLFIDDDGPRFLDTEQGMPLGLGFGEYSETRVPLSPGSRLLFYSDGITEAVNAEQNEYGPCRLVTHALSPDASALSIVDDVRAFSNSAGLNDDATVVLVRVGR